MRLTGGYTNYGQDIGILMLDTNFPRIPGDIGNAKSYEIPVRYKIVKNAQPCRIMGNMRIPSCSTLYRSCTRAGSGGRKSHHHQLRLSGSFSKRAGRCRDVPVFPPL